MQIGALRYRKPKQINGLVDCADWQGHGARKCLSAKEKLGRSAPICTQSPSTPRSVASRFLPLWRLAVVRSGAPSFWSRRSRIWRSCRRACPAAWRSAAARPTRTLWAGPSPWPAARPGPCGAAGVAAGGRHHDGAGVGMGGRVRTSVHLTARRPISSRTTPVRPLMRRPSVGTHPLREGFLTSAAIAAARVLKLAKISRHRSLDTVRGVERAQNSSSPPPLRAAMKWGMEVSSGPAAASRSPPLCRVSGQRHRSPPAPP